MRLCADKYAAVAAMNRLGTLGAKDSASARLRQDALEWDLVASRLRQIAREIEERTTHRHEVQEATEKGTRPTFASLMAEAFPHKVAKRRAA